MPPTTLAAWPISLNGINLSVIADGTKPDVPQALGYSGVYAAQEADNQLVYRDVPKVMSSFRNGAGKVRRTGGGDDDAYGWAEGMLMHLDDGPQMAGEQHSYIFSSISGGPSLLNGSRIIQMIEFLGHLYLITDTEFAIRVPNGDPTQTPVYDPPIGGISANKGFRSGNLARCAEIFQTSGGAQALYVGTNNAGIGRIYECTAAGTWAEGAALAGPPIYLSDKMESVYWANASDGVGAQRLLLKTNTGEVRHCIAGNDPKAYASYGTPIQVGSPSDEIQALVGSELHAYAICNGGIKDFNELRVRNLTSYWKSTQGITKQAAATMRGLPAMLFDDHIVAARGYSADRYPVTQDGYSQRIVGECAPGVTMQDGTPLANTWITAWAEHNGGLLCALWNPDNLTSYVMRGFDRLKVGIPGPGPILWHGAEVVIPPTAGVGLMITSLHVGSPSTSGGATLASQKLYLWMGLALTTGGSSQPVVRYVDLPVLGGPLSIRASGGTAMPRTDVGKIFFTGDNGDDANALKAQRRVDLVHQNVDGTHTIKVYQSADVDPSTLATAVIGTNAADWKLIGTADGSSPDAASTNLVPTAVPIGKMIYTRADFANASFSTTPPRLQEIRLRRNIRYEVFDVRTVNVVLSRNYTILNQGADIRDPDVAWASVVALQLTGPVTYVDETKVSYQVLVEQGIRYSRDLVMVGNGMMEMRTVARLTLSIVKAN